MTPLRNCLINACDYDPATGCFVWKRGTSHGHPCLSIGNKRQGTQKTVLVQRYVYQLGRNLTDEQMLDKRIQSTCGNKLCIAAAHLINEPKSKRKTRTTEKPPQVRGLRPKSVAPRGPYETRPHSVPHGEPYLRPGQAGTPRERFAGVYFTKFNIWRARGIPGTFKTAYEAAAAYRKQSQQQAA